MLQKMYKTSSLQRLFKRKKARITLNVPTELPTLSDKKQFIIETVEFLERNINVNRKL